MTRTPLEAASEALVIAWERWDMECLRRSDHRRSNGTANPNSFFPQTTTTVKMEQAVTAFGALLGLGPAAMRQRLTECMKDGTSYRGAVALAAQPVTADA